MSKATWITIAVATACALAFWGWFVDSEVLSAVGFAGGLVVGLPVIAVASFRAFSKVNEATIRPALENMLAKEEARKVAKEAARKERRQREYEERVAENIRLRLLAEEAERNKEPEVRVIECEDCNGTISRDARQCPHCGKPLPLPRADPTWDAVSCFVAIGIISTIAWIVKTLLAIDPVNGVASVAMEVSRIGSFIGAALCFGFASILRKE